MPYRKPFIVELGARVAKAGDGLRSDVSRLEISFSSYTGNRYNSVRP